MTFVSAVKFLDTHKQEKYACSGYVVTFDKNWHVRNGEHLWIFQFTPDLVLFMQQISPLQDWF